MCGKLYFQNEVNLDCGKNIAYFSRCFPYGSSAFTTDGRGGGETGKRTGGREGGRGEDVVRNKLHSRVIVYQTECTSTQVTVLYTVYGLSFSNGSGQVCMSAYQKFE